MARGHSDEFHNSETGHKVAPFDPLEKMHELHHYVKKVDRVTMIFFEQQLLVIDI